MSLRKASLRAHRASCPNVTKTALSSVGRASGCTCTPSYYVFCRDRDSRPVEGSPREDRRPPTCAGGGAARDRRGPRRDREAEEDQLLQLGRDFEGILDGRISPASFTAHEGLLCDHAQPGPGGVRVAVPGEIGNPELRRFLSRSRS